MVLKTVTSQSDDKTSDLFDLLCFLGNQSTLIFCNFRETVEQIYHSLRKKGIEVAFFHGKMEQLDREKTLVNFRNGSVPFLVATDLAARGLDISVVKNVIHYELPPKKDEFTHRNGRTARMNAAGTAYLLLNPNAPVPYYLTQLPDQLVVPKNGALPKYSDWVTLYINGGKKNKINKVDIVGFLSKKGNLEQTDIGLIEVMDFMSFVAVKKSKLKALLSLIENEKMKGQKYRIEVAK